MKFKIPESIRICGVEYKVDYTEDEMILDGQQCGAIVNYESKVIVLSNKYLTNDRLKETALLHEIIHGIEYERMIDYKNDDIEKITESLARGMCEVLEQL